jgi:hypothetical protein
MTKLDITQPVQTRDGRKARIICHDANSDEAIIALVADEGGIEHALSYYLDGRWVLRRESGADLINVPQKHTVWAVIASEADRPCHLNANVPRIGYAYLFNEKPDDLRHISGIGSTVSACIEIEYQDGEGL